MNYCDPIATLPFVILSAVWLGTVFLVGCLMVRNSHLQNALDQITDANNTLLKEIRRGS